MKIVASIQARLGSTRLPKKVLKKINNKPMLLRQVERLRNSRLVDEVIVATTVNPSDDEIVQFCIENGIKYFRGSEDDVLNRITSLVKENDVDIHVECFGDSPFTDPHIMDEIIGYYLKHQDTYDFVSNSLSTTYPPGLEVLVYSGDSLIKAESLVDKNDPLREHVSIHMTQKPEVFRLKNLEAPQHYHFPEVYLEVDTPEDFQVVSCIFNYFDEQGISHFSLSQILDFIRENQELTSINSEVERRWKQFRKDDNA